MTQKNRNELQKIRYGAALFVTVLILFSGMFFGMKLEEGRVNSLYEDLKSQTLQMQTLLVESKIIEHLVSEMEKDVGVTCEMVEGAYFTSIDKLDEARYKLEDYIQSSTLQEEEFGRLKDFYTNAQIDYYLLGEKVKQTCASDFSTILYFYAESSSCPACEDQGVHLGHVKELKKDDLMVFAFDVERDNSARLLQQRYDVGSLGVPLLVINGATTGFSTYDQILVLLEE